MVLVSTRMTRGWEIDRIDHNFNKDGELFRTPLWIFITTRVPRNLINFVSHRVELRMNETKRQFVKQ